MTFSFFSNVWKIFGVVIVTDKYAISKMVKNRRTLEITFWQRILFKLPIIIIIIITLWMFQGWAIVKFPMSRKEEMKIDFFTSKTHYFLRKKLMNHFSSQFSLTFSPWFCHLNRSSVIVDCDNEIKFLLLTWHEVHFTSPLVHSFFQSQSSRKLQNKQECPKYGSLTVGRKQYLFEARIL